MSDQVGHQNVGFLMTRLILLQQEYKELANQLSEYVVKLLDRVRTQEELELVLNKTGKSQSEKYSTLARFNLALQYDEKKVHHLI